MDYRKNYQHFLEDPAIDEATRQELAALTDEKEIEDRFYKELEFGTAGLRGIMGAGLNRMNVYIVGRATQGLAGYLNALPGAAQRGVVIAHDSRNQSDAFALRAACVLAANGIKTYLFKGLRAVPQLSFAIGHLGCAAGIVVTASHNPPAYNGYKVYGENGAQINPDQAAKITRCIQAVENFSDVKLIDADQAVKQGTLVWIGEEEDDAYYAYTASTVLDQSVMTAAKDLKVVYTPLFGSGRVPVKHMLTQEAGIQQFYEVAAQCEPNGDFPGLSAPNPENPEAFDEARKVADEVGADLILATDPDADRLGVAVRDGSGFTVLTGNQIGCLMLNYRLMKLKELRRLPENGLVVKSIVSTNFADAICRKYGVRLDSVLTGFRFIGEKIDECVRFGKNTFLFGFEESYGYLSGNKVRDKDAICAALMIAETAAWYSLRGMTLLQGLHELFGEYGWFKEGVRSFTLYGVEGMAKIQAAMARVRENPPAEIAGAPVLAVRDYKRRLRTAGGEKEPLDLPASDVLYYELPEDGWLCVRPSGTEPKLKAYAGCKAADAAQAAARAAEMLDYAQSLLGME